MFGRLGCGACLPMELLAPPASHAPHLAPPASHAPRLAPTAARLSGPLLARPVPALLWPPRRVSTSPCLHQPLSPPTPVSTNHRPRRRSPSPRRRSPSPRRRYDDRYDDRYDRYDRYDDRRSPRRDERCAAAPLPRPFSAPALRHSALPCTRLHRRYDDRRYDERRYDERRSYERRDERRDDERRYDERRYDDERRDERR